MSTEIVKVVTNKQIRKFIRFQEQLFKNDPKFVPCLRSDEMNTLYKDRNPAFEFCEADYFLAYKDGKICGRVAAIINHNANRDWKENIVRFGWLDMIDDIEVTKALLDTVADWGRKRDCTSMKGPLGFTDMDKEGLLIEGFDGPISITVIYNRPYYVEHLEKLGFKKSADWTQKMVTIKDEIPAILSFSDKVTDKYGLHYLHFNSSKEMSTYGHQMFHTLNHAFHDLFEFTELTEKQIDCYVKQYVPLMNTKLVGMVADENGELAAFAICMPSLTKAFRKAKGRLFPFGWFHILRALRKNNELDALMIGVLPKYQGAGAFVVLIRNIYESIRDFGIKKLYMNPQLETNVKVQTAFDYLEPEQFARRRCYVKSI